MELVLPGDFPNELPVDASVSRNYAPNVAQWDDSISFIFKDVQVFGVEFQQMQTRHICQQKTRNSKGEYQAHRLVIQQKSTREEQPGKYHKALAGSFVSRKSCAVHVQILAVQKYPFWKNSLAEQQKTLKLDYNTQLVGTARVADRLSALRFLVTCHTFTGF